MCLAALVFLPTASAATINVPGDYPSLQAAIDAAGDGDTIIVSTGTYGISGQINQYGYSTAILIKDKNDLTIQSAPGHEPVIKPVTTVESDIVSISIENCDNLIIDNIDSDQTVSQFDNWHVFNSDFLTLRNSEFEGGEDGIDFNTALNTALIENNIFKDITTGSGDEVLDFTDAACNDVTIQDNFFDYNYRHMTLDNGDSNFIIRRNIMDGTNSQEAVRLIDASNILIENNIIMNNMQQGVYIDSGCSDITIQHNSFFNNDQESGPNGEIRTKILTADIIIKNNIIHGNGLNNAFETTATSLPGEDYNCVFNTADIGSFIFGPNTLTAQDPKFISTTAGSEDLHLQDSSPCIDSGINLGVITDLENNPRDANPDIGAYEYIEPCEPDIPVNTGYDPDATCSNGARWRNFKFNHNGWDMAVGANIGDAGSAGIDWSHYDWNIANNYYFTPDGPNIFTYTYDAGTGLQTVEALIDGGTFSQTHNNGNLGTLNYLQFDIVGRDGQTVEFNNVVLSVDGTDYNLCDYEAGGWKTWYIDSLDLTDGFSITGEVFLTGQSTCQECSKINICAGSSCTPICRNVEDNIEFCSIQEAIDASTTDNGETIEVYAGTFQENAASYCDINLYKDVNIIGQGSTNTIIELTEGKSEGLQITSADPTDITLEGITFTYQTGSTNAAKRALRVFSDLDSLTLRDVIVEYAEVNNVEINGDITTLTIEDCTFHHAGTNGLMCPGDINSGSILNSNFDYNGRLDVWASGIHLFGLTSNLDITSCSMSHNKDSGFNGRQLNNVYFEDCMASYNTHSGGGYGIAISEKATTSSDITMIDITAEHNGRDGIMVWAWYDYCSISDVTITEGLFSNNGWAGIRVLNWPASGSIGGTITNVEITEAQIENNPNAGVWFELDYASSDATTSLVNYNNIIGNGNYGILNSGDGLLDATCNWWGDNNGPSGVGPGSGDPVSNNVRYCPWLTDEYPYGDCTGGAICWNQNTGEYFCSIQAAIDDPDTNDNVGDHDTIEVFAVTDVEQVNVYKSVTIYGQGAGNTIIQSPDTLTDYFTTSNANYPIIYINTVDDVIIHNLTIDGAGKGNANYRFVGIGIYQVGATIKDVEVINVRDTPFSGSQHGVAIYGWADRTGFTHDVIVQDCLVYDYQKTGIALGGPDLNADINNCEVTGVGPTTVTAQNGIQVSHGATGSITENEVSGCSYTGPSWAASGILPYLAGGVLDISNNVITENQANIYLGACSADITNNIVTASAAGTGQTYFYGIIGDPGDPPIIPDAQPVDDGTPPLDRTTYYITCTGNEVTGDGSSGGVGIGVYAGMYGNYDIEFTAMNNNVNDWGMGFELYEYGTNDLISADINYNNIVGNMYGIYNWLTTTYDCECNWYGDPLGPTHSTNPLGSGDSVSDYIDYLPWLNLPFEDPNSLCGAGICQDTVYVDDDFKTSTPGWYVDHFPTIQIALERLSSYGTAIIYDGIYDEDIIVDEDNCDNTGITIIGSYECFPTVEAAVIKGDMIINADDVTIKYLEFTPRTNGAITVEDGVTGTLIECNKFRKDCVADAIGVQALGNALVDAPMNWWGAVDGPQGGLLDGGQLAKGFGVNVFGDVMVEPWIGVHAIIAEPTGTIEIAPGELVTFDASGSFAYSFGDCCEQTLLHMQYLWDFDDGMLSANKVATHQFNAPGTYEVSLQVDAPGIPGLYSNFMYDWDYVTVHVVEPGTPLTVNADGENLGGYETMVGEPVHLYGDAYGGEDIYHWSWSFGDGSQSSKQNPTHVYDTAGTFTVELTVTSGGESASDTADVIVYDIDELRVNLADGSAVAGSETYFAASVTGGEKPYTYLWDFGDGQKSTESQPSHMYISAGEYIVTVTITDSDGMSATATAVMNVDEAVDIEPVEINSVSGGLFLSAEISSGNNPVEWIITVDGSVFFGGSDTGDLPAGVTETIKAPLTIGFGLVDITVSANEVTKEYSAFLLGPFFLNIQEK